MRKMNLSFRAKSRNLTPQHGKNDSYVYILTNHSGTLYVGITRDLATRKTQHKDKVNKDLRKNININKLIYYEVYQYIEEGYFARKTTQKLE